MNIICMNYFFVEFSDEKNPWWSNCHGFRI